PSVALRLLCSHKESQVVAVTTATMQATTTTTTTRTTTTTTTTRTTTATTTATATATAASAMNTAAREASGAGIPWRSWQRRAWCRSIGSSLPVAPSSQRLRRGRRCSSWRSRRWGRDCCLLRAAPPRLPAGCRAEARGSCLMPRSWRCITLQSWSGLGQSGTSAPQSRSRMPTSSRRGSSRLQNSTCELWAELPCTGSVRGTLLPTNSRRRMAGQAGSCWRGRAQAAGLQPWPAGCMRAGPQHC
ncbi:unnamed protein product, partial [Polarella glacialis]